MSAPRSNDIAIVGLAVRVPGARNVDEFWANLRAGREAVTFFTDEELRRAGVDAARLARPNYVKANAVLPDADRFDAAFFGFTPREAELLDVQQRIFLECAWTAIEHAGYDPLAMPGAVGVFAGAGLNTRFAAADREKSRGDCVGGRLPGDDRERQGFSRHARLLQTQPPRPEPRRADRLFDVTRRGARGNPEPARR